jgi:hypothetical protein
MAERTTFRAKTDEVPMYAVPTYVRTENPADMPMAFPADDRITYAILGREVLRLDANGDIFVNGRLAANDLEVVEAMRFFLIASGHLAPT